MTSSQPEHFEIDGERAQVGLPPVEELETMPLTPEEVEAEDPDAWRQYADLIDRAQLAWLEKHLEHDWSDILEGHHTRAN